MKRILSFVLKALSILLPIHAIYCVFNFLWIRLMITILVWLFVGYLGQKIDCRYSSKELSLGRDINGKHLWDDILDGMDYNILKKDVIDFIGVIEKEEKIKNKHYYVPEEVKNL